MRHKKEDAKWPLSIDHFKQWNATLMKTDKKQKKKKKKGGKGMNGPSSVKPTQLDGSHAQTERYAYGGIAT